MSLSEHNLLVVDDDDDFIDEAKRLFDGRLPVARSLENAMSAIEGGQLRMVLLGPSFATESSMGDIRSIHNIDPGLVLILVAEEVTSDLLRSGMRVGLSDVLEAPLNEQKIEAAIEQFAGDVLERETRGATPQEVVEPETGKGRVITVMSAKGGSGKTVTATNLALLLTRYEGKRVALVDADLQFGDCCLVLQLEPRFTMVNAAHEMHHLDAAMLASLLTEHSSGLKVLAAPLEPAFADDITTAGLMKMIELLRESFDYVVVDTASMLDELLLSLVEAGDHVLMVVDMDLPSVKNAKLALETLRLLKFPTDKVQLVMNRANAKAKLDEKEIESALKMKISASVPSDGAVAASVNAGSPVVESAPKSRIAKGFESVAELIGGRVPEPTSGKGLFGRK
ncbi:MAG TPA: AAA family ATPase [Acidimicrobiia bacterium]|nr:AAA family ATPase [Acidimicrobiia bacterium]